VIRFIDTSGKAEKNGGSKEIGNLDAVRKKGENVKSVRKLQKLGAMALLGVGLAVAGCKSAPPLSQADALKMIQANYDQAQPANTDIVVNDLGMRQGVTAKYWEGTKKYPNGYWADFKLTPEGKKLVKLASGGDTIEWRPESPNDPHYSVTMTTVAGNRLKARDVQDIEDVADTKTAGFTEDVDLSSLPDALQGIAHNPGNQLSTHRSATFVQSDGGWKLKSVQ